MTPTALYLALGTLLLAGVVVGAILLNVPPLWTALAALIAITAAVALASSRPRHRP